MPNPAINQAISQASLAVAPSVAPASKTFWSVITSNPTAFWSMLTLIFNIILSIANVVWFHAKRANKRKYDLEFTFYELLVINSSKCLIEFSSKMKKELHSLALKARNGSKGGFSRKDVEEHIEHLDQFMSELRLNTIPLIKGYSLGLGDKIDLLAEDCYDKTTDIFTKFNRRTVPVDLENRLCGNFSVLETKYIEHVFKNIKEHCPHC